MKVVICSQSIYLRIKIFVKKYKGLRKKNLRRTKKSKLSRESKKPIKLKKMKIKLRT